MRLQSGARHKDFDLTNKCIAVIGTGASAIQIIPSIVDKVASLTVFQRTPAWIMPKDQSKVGRLKKTIFKYIPLTNKIRRLFYYLKFELRGLGLIYPKVFNKSGQKMALRFLARSVSNEKLRKKLTPNYSIGCKRVLLSNDYYPAMNKTHVELITEGIKSFSHDAICSVDGKKFEFDAVICATGFKVTEEAPPFKILGRGSKDLNQHWHAGAHAYLGLATHDFPNLFFILGPNTGLGHNSIIYMIESQVKLLSRLFLHARQHGLDQLEISQNKENAYQEEISKKFKGSVWTDGTCKSWYLTEQGKNVSLWPSFSFSFRKRLNRSKPSSFLANPNKADSARH